MDEIFFTKFKIGNHRLKVIIESANQDKNNIEINVNVKCFVKQNSRDNERKR